MAMLDDLLKKLRENIKRVDDWIDDHDTVGDAKKLSEEYLPSYIDKHVKDALDTASRLLDALSDPDVPDLRPDIVIPTPNPSSTQPKHR